MVPVISSPQIAQRSPAIAMKGNRRTRLTRSRTIRLLLDFRIPDRICMMSNSFIPGNQGKNKNRTRSSNPALLAHPAYPVGKHAGDGQNSLFCGHFDANVGSMDWVPPSTKSDRKDRRSPKVSPSRRFLVCASGQACRRSRPVGEKGRKKRGLQRALTSLGVASRLDRINAII